MPLHCVWNKQQSAWTLRKQRPRKTIGRLCGASPTEQERYFLYLLLLHTPGATHWNDLLRVPEKDELARNFEDAARQRGLIEDADELRLAMRDAQT